MSIDLMAIIILRYNVITRVVLITVQFCEFEYHYLELVLKFGPLRNGGRRVGAIPGPR